jgi:aquaporin Z
MTSSTAKYAVEAIGTFFLVLAAALYGPLAAGFMLTAMIFAGGHISGGHYNPAVSIAVFIRGRLTQAELIPYIGAQIAGCVAAGLLVGWLTEFGDTVSPLETFDDAELAIQVFLLELLITFALAWTVLNVATSSALVNNQFYGLAIGAVVIGGGLAVGDWTGAAFNPAVGLGATISGAIEWGNIWVYLIGCPIGGALAGFAFKALAIEDTHAEPDIAPPA